MGVLSRPAALDICINTHTHIYILLNSARTERRTQRRRGAAGGRGMPATKLPPAFVLNVKNWEQF